MSKGFSGIGICQMCGDLNGPFVWDANRGWLCEDCYEKINNTEQPDDDRSGEKTKDIAD